MSTFQYIERLVNLLDPEQNQIPNMSVDEALQRLEELARRHDATLFMVLLAAFQTILGRWSGQDRVMQS